MSIVTYAKSLVTKANFCVVLAFYYHGYRLISIFIYYTSKQSAVCERTIIVDIIAQFVIYYHKLGGNIMHWFWWVVIGFVAMFILGKLCEDRPGFRNVLCCIIALAYPILAIVTIDSEKFGFVGWAILGPIVLAYYKFVYDFAERLDGESDGDLIFSLFENVDFFSWIFDIDSSFIALVVSVVLAIIFAVIPIALVFVFAQFSVVLSCIMLFVPFVYCLFCTIRYFRENY